MFTVVLMMTEKVLKNICNFENKSNVEIIRNEYSPDELKGIIDYVIY